MSHKFANSSIPQARNREPDRLLDNFHHGLRQAYTFSERWGDCVPGDVLT